MTIRGAVAGCVVLVCLVTLLVERTEGYMTFLSPQEMKRLQEQEGKKDMEPRSEDGQAEEGLHQQLPLMDRDGSPDKTLEIAVRIPSKQLSPMAPVLREIIHEIVEEHQKAK